MNADSFQVLGFLTADFTDVHGSLPPETQSREALLSRGNDRREWQTLEPGLSDYRAPSPDFGTDRKNRMNGNDAPLSPV